MCNSVSPACSGEWLGILDERGSVDVIFLDFAKAFDKVSHPHPLLKLQNYGIKGQLLEWILDFLTTRRQRVVIDGHSYRWSDRGNIWRASRKYFGTLAVSCSY